MSGLVLANWFLLRYGHDQKFGSFRNYLDVARMNGASNCGVELGLAHLVEHQPEEFVLLDSLLRVDNSDHGYSVLYLVALSDPAEYLGQVNFHRVKDLVCLLKLRGGNLHTIADGRREDHAEFVELGLPAGKEGGQALVSRVNPLVPLVEPGIPALAPLCRFLADVERAQEHPDRLEILDQFELRVLVLRADVVAGIGDKVTLLAPPYEDGSGGESTTEEVPIEVPLDPSWRRAS